MASTSPTPQPSHPRAKRHASPERGRIFIGPSGYSYPEWRGAFYPEGLPQRSWLDYAAHRFSSIELNGTFYSLKTPAMFERWAAAAPDRGFVFAIKGSRYITHEKKLLDPERGLANFYASGVLALGDKTGPFLWQLPPSLAFDPARVEAFLDVLPRSSAEAEQLAAKHDLRPENALTHAATPRRYRHAIEPRHPSFFTPSFFRILERRGAGLVIADTASRFPYAEEVTADFVYIRLHGSEELYVSDYSEEELTAWADRIEAWARPPSARDVYVYFDNTARGFAPMNAQRLAEKLGSGTPRRAPEQLGLFSTEKH